MFDSIVSTFKKHGVLLCFRCDPYNRRLDPDYIAPANILVAEYGGTYLARTSNHTRLEGKGDAALRIIIEWPFQEAALGFMKDARYTPHLQARTAGSVSNHFLIEGKDNLA